MKVMQPASLMQLSMKTTVGSNNLELRSRAEVNARDQKGIQWLLRGRWHTVIHLTKRHWLASQIRGLFFLGQNKLWLCFWFANWDLYRTKKNDRAWWRPWNTPDKLRLEGFSLPVEQLLEEDGTIRCQVLRTLANDPQRKSNPRPEGEKKKPS